MKRLFLDANVIFTAAHNPAGKASLLIELGQQGHWRLITSRLACEEARRNILIKFPVCFQRMEIVLRNFQIISHSSHMSCTLGLPDKDKPIFLAALQGAATHLITGDLRHFGRFMNQAAQTENIVIQTVSDFFQSILAKQSHD